MKKKKRMIALLIGLCLCLSVFSLGCKPNGSSADDPNRGENAWSDENVDENGWT